MKTLGVRYTVIAAMFLMLSAGFAQGQSTVTVLMGTVLQIIQAGDDLFLKLDINNDGSSDALLKLGLNDTVSNAQGQKIKASDISEGMVISAAATQDSNGYYEPIESRASTTTSQTALSGTVIQVYQLGDTVIAELDTDGDGISDLKVRLEDRDTVLDENGNSVALDSLMAGSQITIPAYRYDNENDAFDAEKSSETSDSSIDDSNNNTDETGSSNDHGQDSNDHNDSTDDHNSDDGNDDGGDDD